MTSSTLLAADVVLQILPTRKTSDSLHHAVPMKIFSLFIALSPFFSFRTYYTNKFVRTKMRPKRFCLKNGFKILCFKILF